MSGHIEFMSFWLGMLSITASALALVVALRGYRRKSGVLIRGSHGITSDVQCDHPYVASVHLQNLKDRPVTIYYIYLRIGWNYYLEVEDLEDQPLTLQAFESCQRAYGPVHFYAFNQSRIGLDELLNDPKVPKRLVLSTSEGRYFVPKRIRHWSPVPEFFSNRLTLIPRAVRTKYKGQAIGNKALFIVEFVASDGAVSRVVLSAFDAAARRFDNLRFSEQTLASRQALEEYLQTQHRAGALRCCKFKVIECSELLERTESLYPKEPSAFPRVTWFQYRVLGPFLTRRADREREREQAAADG